MKNINISSWDDFQRTIDKILKKYGNHEIGGFKEKNRILFRGQPDSKWELKSTLERVSSSPWTVDKYADLARFCSPHIESFTDKNWNLKPIKKPSKKSGTTPYPFDVPIPHYEYWIYLRHHGFPSPLMDWTISPYIAAFFAFAEKNNAKKSSIYMYIESLSGNKTGWVGEPQISVRGPYVRTHKRHFLQQSWYTVCSIDQKNTFFFASHEDVFKRGAPGQDVLFKISIPRSERLTALSYLDNVNINHFSLFQSEDSLVRTLAMKEIELKKL